MNLAPEPRVHILQLLCPERHCVIAVTYLASGLTFEKIREYLDATRQGHPERNRCGICGSELLAYEDGVTRYTSMEEADPLLRASEAMQWASRAFLDSIREDFAEFKQAADPPPSSPAPAARWFAIVSGERGIGFRRVIGTNRIPITSPMPIRCELPDRVEDCYFIDLGRITPQQRASLINYIVSAFGIPDELAGLELDRQGCPILATDCIVEGEADGSH